MPPGILLSAMTTNNSFVNGHKGAGCGRDWEIVLLNSRKDTDSRRIAQGDFPWLRAAGFEPWQTMSARLSEGEVGKR